MERRTSLVLVLLMASLVLNGCGWRGLYAGRYLGRMLSQPPPAPAHFHHRDPAVPSARLVVTWVGHATALIQMDDKFVLTDPVFTNTVGMVARRSVEPGLSPEELPKIDAALVSHMHFDHLSLGSLDRIEDKVEEIVVPYGGLAYVPGSHVSPIELDTWETVELDGMRITATPVEHPGWRYGGDRAWRTTAATAYLVEYRGLKVFFGGDTARSSWMFRAVGRRHPGIELALLPIAPINPRQFMCHFHMDPSEALDAFFDLGARVMVPIHFDTFFNTFDEEGEAPTLLRKIARERDLPDERVAILQHGERRVLVGSEGDH